MTARSGLVSANCAASFPYGVFCVPAPPIEVQSGPTRGGAEFADTGRVSGGAEQYPSTWGSPILPSSAGRDRHGFRSRCNRKPFAFSVSRVYSSTTVMNLPNAAIGNNSILGLPTTIPYHSTFST